jgi:hypothetical protein
MTSHQVAAHVEVSPPVGQCSLATSALSVTQRFVKLAKVVVRERRRVAHQFACVWAKLMGVHDSANELQATPLGFGYRIFEL